MTFTPNLASASLQDLINQSIVQAMCGALGVDVVRGLLLLSLAQLSPKVAHGAYDPLSLIAMAYTMGLRLGLEDQSRMMSASSTSWSPVTWETMLMVSVMLLCQLTYSGKWSSRDTDCEFYPGHSSLMFQPTYTAITGILSFTADRAYPRRSISAVTSYDLDSRTTSNRKHIQYLCEPRAGTHELVRLFRSNLRCSRTVD
jgi:hypothetical protein